MCSSVNLSFILGFCCGYFVLQDNFEEFLFDDLEQFAEFVRFNANVYSIQIDKNGDQILQLIENTQSEFF